MTSATSRRRAISAIAAALSAVVRAVVSRITETSSRVHASPAAGEARPPDDRGRPRTLDSTISTPSGQPSGGDRLAEMPEWESPTLVDVLEARRRIAPYLRPTPLYALPALDELVGTHVLVKHENHQPVGAFKVRGGVNLVAQLTAAERERGVFSARRPGTTASRSPTRPGCSACRRRSACPRGRTR